MELYPHDCSYLFTEYGRRKAQECYDIESREKEKALDDGEQEGHMMKLYSIIPGIRPRTSKRDWKSRYYGDGDVRKTPPNKGEQEENVAVIPGRRPRTPKAG